MSSRNCIVYPCRRRGGFRLPLNPELKLKWLEAIKWPIIPLEPKKTAIVCPTHFTEDDYSDGEEGCNIGKKILKKNAIPSRFPWNTDLWSKEEVEKNGASTSQSLTDDEEAKNSDDESNQSADFDIESGSESSPDENSSEDEVAAQIVAEEIVADEIVTISSDDDPPQSTHGGLRKPPSPVTFWEASPACQEVVKSCEPEGSRTPEDQRPPKRRRYDFATSPASSRSSNDEGPSEKSSNNQTTVIVINPEVQRPPLQKTEDDEDSDGSDCILCEKPIESIDLTADDPVPSPIKSPQILFNESDSSDDTSLTSDGLSDEAIDILESSPPLLLDKSLTSETDSDCEIIEDNPPLIEILESDDENLPAVTTYMDTIIGESGDGNQGFLFTRSKGGMTAQVIKFDMKDKPSEEETDPFAGVTNGEFDPLTGVPTLDRLTDASCGKAGATSPVTSSSGNMSPVASKDPNAPSIVKKAYTSVRTLYSQREKLNLSRKKTEGLICPAEIPRDYEVVGIHPTSKSLRIVLTKKKKRNNSSVRNSVPAEMEVSVDPLTACLHEDETSNVTSKPVRQRVKRRQLIGSVVLKDLASEESQLSSVVLLRNSEGFEPHCEALAKKLNDIIRKSEIMAGRLSPETIMSMYKLLVLSEISYGIIYWGHCQGAHQIFELQKRFVGMLAHREKPESKASRATFRQNGILTLPSIYILHCLIHVHKNLNTVKRHAALRLSETEGVKYSTTHNKTYEFQGLEFYLALPPHLHSPHCSMKKFIAVVKRFLRQNGIFNTLEYYDMASRFPKVIEKSE
uniref:THAP-type domain-containing protein n=1 Tax=Lygus hesperus TaxID=30085 RepID=A0A0A9X0S8_LYGHE